MNGEKTISGNQVAVAFLGILTLFALGVVLKLAQSVILPLIIAWLLSYILAPVVTMMTRRRIPAPVAVGIVLILLLGVIYLAAVFLHARVNAFVAAFPRYETRLNELLDTLSERWSLTPETVAGIQWGPYVRSFLVRVSGPLVSFTSALVMVMVFLIFLLLGKPFFADKVRAAFSSQKAEHFIDILNSITRQIGRYLYVQLLVSLATGVLVWLILFLIGIDFAVTWGALAFFLNFIPTIGSVLASIPPVLLAIVQCYPAWWPVILTLLGVTTVQMTIGNVVTPKLMGDRLNLSPVVVLLSLLFWGWLWGFVGALLSVPIASAIKIVCENIEPLHPLSVMMGSGRVYQTRK
ncbi:MAG: AI-2E family transporter [Lentisphaerae bacterium]|nr:AI-2E family transporter [Lentisphaerota bacterium]